MKLIGYNQRGVFIIKLDLFHLHPNKIGGIDRIGGLTAQGLALLCRKSVVFDDHATGEATPLGIQAAAAPAARFQNPLPCRDADGVAILGSRAQNRCIKNELVACAGFGPPVPDLNLEACPGSLPRVNRKLDASGRTQDAAADLNAFRFGGVRGGLGAERFGRHGRQPRMRRTV